MQLSLSPDAVGDAAAAEWRRCARLVAERKAQWCHLAALYQLSGCCRKACTRGVGAATGCRPPSPRTSVGPSCRLLMLLPLDKDDDADADDDDQSDCPCTEEEEAGAVLSRPVNFNVDSCPPASRTDRLVCSRCCAGRVP